MQNRASTDTEVANLALSRLRRPGISSLADGVSQRSRVMRLHYAIERDVLLRRYHWNFAEGRAKLAADSDAPVSEFKYQYTLPVNCVHVRRIDEDAKAQYRVSERKILTDCGAPLAILYTRNDVPEAHWDPLFLKAFTFALAEAGAHELTIDERIIENMDRSHEEELRKAFPADAMEAGPGVVEFGDVIAEYDRGRV